MKSIKIFRGWDGLWIDLFAGVFAIRFGGKFPSYYPERIRRRWVGRVWIFRKCRYSREHGWRW